MEGADPERSTKDGETLPTDPTTKQKRKFYRTYKDPKRLFLKWNRFRITAAYDKLGFHHVQNLASPISEEIIIERVKKDAAERGISGGEARIIVQGMEGSNPKDNWKTLIKLPVIAAERQTGAPALSPDLMYVMNQINDLKNEIAGMQSKSGNGNLAQTVAALAPVLTPLITGVFSTFQGMMRQASKPPEVVSGGLDLKVLMPILELGKEIGYMRAAVENSGDDGDAGDGANPIGALMNMLSGGDGSQVGDLNTIIDALGNLTRSPVPGPVPEPEAPVENQPAGEQEQTEAEP